MMPSASELTYFLEVASSLNLSRAAERIGISQPTLSLAIQRLETAIGAPLLIRSKRGVMLTQAGKQLHIHAKTLLQSWESVRGQALASTHEMQGSYTIGCHVSVALYSLPCVMAQLLDKNPKIDVRLVHDLSRKIAERVIQTEVDIGIVVNPMKHPDLVIRTLTTDEVTFWVGKGHRNTQDFRSGEAVLICDPDLLQTQNLTKKLKKSGVKYGRILATSSLEVVTELTVSGAGIGIIPTRVVESSGARGLEPIRHAPTFSDEICLIYRVENRGIRAIQVIADQLVEKFKS